MASILKKYRQQYKQQKIIRQFDPPPQKPEKEPDPIWEYLDKYADNLYREMAEEIIVQKFHIDPFEAHDIYVAWRNDYIERELSPKQYKGRKR